MADETINLFLILFGVLSLASLIGFILKARVGFAVHSVIDNLNSRIKAWWVMIIIIGIAFYFGKNGVIVLFFIVSFLALREFLTITGTTSADHRALLASFFLILPIQYGLIYYSWYGLFSIFIPVWAFLFLPVLAAVHGNSQNFLARTTQTQWALMLSVFCISHVPALMILDIPGYQGRNLLLLFFLIMVVQISDVLQYVWGKLFGKHKIAPDLSPSKTWEGFVGGVLSSSAIGASLYWITPFSVYQAGAIALIITLMGFLGGLVMSAIKRDRGIKDWGHMIEGHGGMLDRMDSVCFAAPVFFHIVRFYFA